MQRDADGKDQRMIAFQLLGAGDLAKVEISSAKSGAVEFSGQLIRRAAE